MSQDSYGRHESFRLDKVLSPLRVARRLEPRSRDTPPCPHVVDPRAWGNEQIASFP